MTSITKTSETVGPNGAERPGPLDRLMQLWRKLVSSASEDLLAPILKLPGIEGPGGVRISLGVIVVLAVAYALRH